jgi:hypothetical protein
MGISRLAGQSADPSLLINVPRLVTEAQEIVHKALTGSEAEPHANRVKREKKTQHEGHEAYEERKLNRRRKKFSNRNIRTLRVLRDLRG